MIKALSACLLLTTTAVWAQTSNQPPAQPEKVYVFRLTASQAFYVGRALAMMPYGEAKPVVEALQKQIDEQNKPAEPSPEPQK